MSELKPQKNRPVFGMECMTCGNEFESYSFDITNDWECTCEKPEYQSMGPFYHSEEEAVQS